MNTPVPFFLLLLSAGGLERRKNGFNLEAGYDVMKTLVYKDKQYGNDFGSSGEEMEEKET